MTEKNNIKTPSTLRGNLLYENWKKEIIIWQHIPKLESKKQALAIFLSLKGKARETILEIDIESLNKEDGVEKVLVQLDKVRFKDKIELVYQAYDTFEKFKRPSEMSIAAFVVEFERLYCKAKACNMVWPNGNLAYKFLRNANVSSSHTKLVRTTITKLS